MASLRGIADPVRPRMGWALPVTIVLMFLSGCVNNPNYIALEDTVQSWAEDSSSGSATRPQDSPPPRQANSDTDTLPDTYVVENGDTLYSIAFRYSRDFRELAAANNIDPPYLIVPGQKINTRARATAAAPNPAQMGTESSKEQPEAMGSVQPAPRSEPGQVGDLGWIWPVQGDLLAEFSNGATGTKGIDISAEIGTPVQAAAGGKVVYAGDGLRGYGNLIILEHPGRILSAYAFTENIRVAEQQEVRQGDRIADVGERGGTSFLHFEIRAEGKPVDPIEYLP